ncbi:LAME_0B05314g1_1 [Lachancea meyersii CBS 8951]|uniref:LAME_0B05314g1_1 n=1 Tax=Lachancea meyersii CBS 8951 TaxID=1266667 RepID=A0A1G4IVH2_9SACH|nr:LAME_0B05314g1_1 [Lachancea meyersii CBS 8951]
MSEVANELGFDPTLKKKKKSKKVVDVPDANGASTVAAVTGEEDLFSGLKKKKKKSKESSKESGDIQQAVDEVDAALGELKLKKKKKKSKESSVDDFEKELAKAGVATPTDREGSAGASREGSLVPGEDSALQQDAGLPYQALLSRFFETLRTNNPELAGDRSGPKFRIPPPVCQRDGKKTIFCNIQEISEKLQRNPEHLIQYLFAELGTSGSVDGQKRLVMKGKFMPKQMENVLRRYILEYVTCKTCKSINTDLRKEQSNRLFFLVCKSCGSTRSVSSIKTGFQAIVGKRKRM